MLSPEFLLTSLVVVLVPGTGVIYTVTTGLTQRGRASLVAALGCTLGIVPHLTASILGLSAILHMSARVFQAIKWAGVLYLLYLAWGMWHDEGGLQLDQNAEKGSAWQIIGQGHPDQYPQSQTDAVLLRFPAAVHFHPGGIRHAPVGRPQPGIYGHDLRGLYVVWINGQRRQ